LSSNGQGALKRRFDLGPGTGALSAEEDPCQGELCPGQGEQCAALLRRLHGLLGGSARTTEIAAAEMCLGKYGQHRGLLLDTGAALAPERQGLFARVHALAPLPAPEVRA